MRMRKQAVVTCLSFALAIVATTEPALAQRVAEGSLFSASVGSGARALGMGGAFIAIADDATAASWNPAGLAVLERPEASLVVQPRSSFTTDFAPYTYELRDGTFRYLERGSAYTLSNTSRTLDFASFTFPFRMGSVKVVPQFNYQRAVDLGLDPDLDGYDIEGGDSDVGLSRTFRGGGGLSGDFSGGLDVFAGSLGVGLSEKVYLGVSLNFWRNGSDGTRISRFQNASTGGNIPFTIDQTVTTTAEETFKGVNLSLGAMFKPTQKLRLGVVFKTPFTMEHTLTTRSERTGTHSLLGAGFPQTVTRTESGDIEWPRTIGAGLAVLPLDVLTFSFDWTTTNWADARYDFTRTTTIANNSGTQSSTVSRSVIWPTLFDPAQPEQAVINAAQVDTMQLRFGTEYVLRSPHLFGLTVLPLRAGVYSDRQYFRDTPDLGNVTQIGITGGFGLVWSKVVVDFAYVHPFAKYRSADFSNGSGNFSETQVSSGKDKFSANKFFVSTIVRF